MILYKYYLAQGVREINREYLYKDTNSELTGCGLKKRGYETQLSCKVITINVFNQRSNSRCVVPLRKEWIVK